MVRVQRGRGGGPSGDGAHPPWRRSGKGARRKPHQKRGVGRLAAASRHPAERSQEGDVSSSDRSTDGWPRAADGPRSDPQRRARAIDAGPSSRASCRDDDRMALTTASHVSKVRSGAPHKTVGAHLQSRLTTMIVAGLASFIVASGGLFFLAQRPRGEGAAAATTPMATATNSAAAPAPPELAPSTAVSFEPSLAATDGGYQAAAPGTAQPNASSSVDKRPDPRRLDMHNPYKPRDNSDGKPPQEIARSTSPARIQGTPGRPRRQYPGSSACGLLTNGTRAAVALCARRPARPSPNDMIEEASKASAPGRPAGIDGAPRARPVSSFA